MDKTVIFVAGKSGGHIIPALTLIRRMKRLDPLYRFVFFSTDSLLDKKLVAHGTDVEHHELPLGSISLKSLTGIIKAFMKITYSFFLSMKLLKSIQPIKVISMGGYVSIPVCYAAWVLRIPIELYELNVVPGTAVQYIIPFAQSLFICFPETKHIIKTKTPIYTVGYPIKFEDSDKCLLVPAKEVLKLHQNKKNLFILGGSQGSQFLNNQLKNFIMRLNLSERNQISISHQTGVSDCEMMKSFYAEQGIEAQVFDYTQIIAVYYGAADYIISRAGAGALHEIEYFNKSALIIPLNAVITKHQYENASIFVKKKDELYTLVTEEEINADKNIFYRFIIRGLQIT